MNKILSMDQNQDFTLKLNTERLRFIYFRVLLLSKLKKKDNIQILKKKLFYLEL